MDDPGLLLWVHCAETDSYPHVVRRSGIALSDAQADAYYAEHLQSARLVGPDPADVPDTAGRMAAYFEKARPELALTPEARGADAFLQRPPVPLAAVPARALVRGRAASLAYAALPPWAHELYGRRPRTRPSSPAGCAPQAPRCV
ncbi:hypothetical protein SABIM44S_04950 [Streptomyces abikoensis]